MYFCLFDVAIGTCGLVWNEHGVAGVHLPEKTPAALRKKIISRFPQLVEHAPSPLMKRLIKKLDQQFKGKAVDMQDTPLDMREVPAFHRRVYEVVMQIPFGNTLSYGDVAARLNKKSAARAVGQAMQRNPFPLLMPCHRVLAANGKLGGFTSYDGLNTKRRLLALEGIAISPTDKLMPVKVARKAEVASSATPRNRGKAPVAAMAYSFNVRSALRHLRKSDATLAKLMDRVGRFRLQLNQTQTVFLALAEAIVYQQLHGKAAATIFKRVCELFPESGDFFTAQDIAQCADDKLRGAGLSQNKLLAMRDLASKTLSGALPDMQQLATMSDEDIINALTPVRGIGRWTVEMLLIFRLGRADVLPVDDYGVRKGFMMAWGKREMPTPKALKAYGERWAPYRSVASWYLWRATELK